MACFPFHPQAALNAFLSAGPHQVVKEIQKGNITKPEEVAAAATAAGGGNGKGGSGGGSGEGSQEDGEEEGPLAHDWLLADQVVQRASSSGRVKVRWLWERGRHAASAWEGGMHRRAGESV